jgi:hypothetical protein
LQRLGIAEGPRADDIDVRTPVAGEVLAAGFGPRPISGSAIPSPTSGTVSMILTIGKGFDGATGYFVRADFSLGDFNGQAECQVPSGAASGFIRPYFSR